MAPVTAAQLSVAAFVVMLDAAKPEGVPQEVAVPEVVNKVEAEKVPELVPQIACT